MRWGEDGAGHDGGQVLAPVREPTHRLGNTLDLCMTSSLELVAGVEVTAPLGTSDHSGLEVNIIGMAAEGSTKEEVPGWAKADMRVMKEKLLEVEWECMS